ncbi:SAM-dependent methyltransferase [Albidovulum sp.]|uniref:SAM-dependent methyltransferase n=1 Tax=Albidovulum sp. TaxID=1872424 RepID=UPI0039B9941C
MTADTAEVRPGEELADLPASRDAGLIFIGRIETPWTLRAECPRGGDAEHGPDCRVILDPRWQAALNGLAAGDGLQLLYWMDRARRDLVLQSPRNDGQTLGTFAIRSPCRPNPIASSVVRLIALEGPCLVVRGLDCVSGTPLLDIKPHRLKAA